MSVTACQYAKAVGECRVCGKPISAKVEHPEGKEGAHVLGTCGHSTYVRNFEPLGEVDNV